MSAPSFWSRLARLESADRVLLVESSLALAFSSLAIALLPFRWLAAWLDSVRGDRQSSAAPDEAIRRCRWAVEAAARRLPLRTVCFQKGLALHLMLRRRGVRSVLHYGVGTKPSKQLSAHVWISESGRIILGGEVAANHECLVSFPEPKSRGKPARGS